MPEEIIPPSFRGVHDSQGYHQHWVPTGLSGLANQMHSCLIGSAAPFFLIAWQTAGDDILPDGLAS
jgi:hypothetical protein